METNQTALEERMQALEQSLRMLSMVQIAQITALHAATPSVTQELAEHISAIGGLLGSSGLQQEQAQCEAWAARASQAVAAGTIGEMRQRGPQLARALLGPQLASAALAANAGRTGVGPVQR